MSQPYVGEIRCFGFNFAPRDWAFCNGQIMPIAQNEALFAILGTTYGGDGQTTYALPNLQGRVPMHWGNSSSTGLNTQIGEAMGQATVTLNTNQIPAHAHQIAAADINPQATRSAAPTAASYLSTAKGTFVYQKPPVTPNATFSPRAITQTGNSFPHENMQPYLAVNFCISLFGIFPTRN